MSLRVSAPPSSCGHGCPNPLSSPTAAPCCAPPGISGHDEFASFAPGLKSLVDAEAIRSKLLRAYETAETEEDPSKHRDLLAMALVGAGPTGAELAGAIAHMVEKDGSRIQTPVVRQPTDAWLTGRQSADMAIRMQTLLGLLLLALAIGACASMGPMFPANAGAAVPPDFDRSDCCRQD